MGLELPDPNVGDGKTHIVMLVDRGFAASAIGLRFSEAFPNSRHIISTVTVPEPAGLGLWASALAALVLLRRRA